ncbi:MAG: bis(5'-nucleosyl)-tetraphosphatase (symmetrical) YqeK [Eubacteriales bacterium]|nr:bis(5'-nucleosyl)-tetraphosphatase (symmetrical) YqeK [Eubacteriales bacterium]
MDYILKNDRWQITKQLKRRLSKKRYIHSLSVAYTAAALAMVHDVNPEDAIMAGLLHDYAKNISHEEQLAYCDKHRIELSAYERRNPQIIHGKVGALMIMRRYHVRDENIINAIMNHTVGRMHMSPLEKIIFIADYIEPEREPLPNIQAIRKAAFKNLDRTIYMILENTRRYLVEKGGTPDESTEAVLNYYKEEAEHADK